MASEDLCPQSPEKCPFFKKKPFKKFHVCEDTEKHTSFIPADGCKQTAFLWGAWAAPIHALDDHALDPAMPLPGA